MIPLRHIAMLAVLLPMTAEAQDAAPERVVESFGAWEVRCERTDAADAASALACEMAQATTVQGESQPITQIAIGRPAPDADMTAVVQMPLGMWLPSGAALDLGAAGSYPIAILRCLPVGCIGELALTDDMRDALTDESLTDSVLAFEMQGGTPLRIPVVHQGFAAALTALEARLDQ